MAHIVNFFVDGRNGIVVFADCAADSGELLLEFVEGKFCFKAGNGSHFVFDSQDEVFVRARHAGDYNAASGAHGGED